MTKESLACIELTDGDSVKLAVQVALDCAEEAGFGITQRYMFATAVSELATNIVKYAGNGTIEVRNAARRGRRGLEAVAEDEGPGIADIETAMRAGFSTGGSLGIGLGGVRGLTDEMDIDTDRRTGTRIAVRKWLPREP